MPSHNEPCPRCPPFVVRCGQRHTLQLMDFATGRTCHPDAKYYLVTTAGAFRESSFPTRAEADAEFDRREETLARPPP